MTAWLVTGASGFLGANIGACLTDRTTRVAVTRSGAVPTMFDQAIPGDLRDMPRLVSEIEALRPDVIVHAAALASHETCESDPALARRINATSTGDLAGVAQRIGAQFVYISTDAVFDGTRGNYSETDATNPTSVYGQTKLEGEALASQATDALIIRTNFFGWSPTGRRSILEFFVNELSAGHPVKGFTDFTTTSAYAQVLAEAIGSLVAKSVTGVFHVTSPDALTKYDFGVAVAEEFGLDSGLITPTQADVHPPRKGDISLDVSKTESTLGSALPTQLEGIARAHADATTLRPSLSHDEKA